MMKLLIVSLMLINVFCDESFFKNDKKVLDIKDECATRYKIDRKEMKSVDAGNLEDEQTFKKDNVKCYLECVLEKTKIMTSGPPTMKNLMELLEVQKDDNRVVLNANKCWHESRKMTESCKCAFIFYECMVKERKKDEGDGTTNSKYTQSNSKTGTNSTRNGTKRTQTNDSNKSTKLDSGIKSMNSTNNNSTKNGNEIPQNNSTETGNNSRSGNNSTPSIDPKDAGMKQTNSTNDATMKSTENANKSAQNSTRNGANSRDASNMNNYNMSNTQGSNRPQSGR